MKLKPYQHKYTHTQCTNSKRCVSYINTTNTHGHSIFIIQHNFKPFWIFGAKTEIIDRLYWITHKSSPSSKLRVCTPRNWGRQHVNWFTQVWGLWKPSNAVTCSCSDLMNLNCFVIWVCLRRRKNPNPNPNPKLIELLWFSVFLSFGRLFHHRCPLCSFPAVQTTNTALYFIHALILFIFPLTFICTLNSVFFF